MSVCRFLIPAKRAAKTSEVLKTSEVSLVLSAAVVALTLSIAAPSHAQPPQPAITSIFPAGGQKGKTLEATITGTNLQGVAGVHLTGTGITGKATPVVNPNTKAVDPNTVRVSLAIAPDAALGERDIRLLTPGGLSNRFRFIVGDVPEVNEKEPNSEPKQAQRLESLPIVVNGQITQPDRDFFRFTAKAGQTLVCEVDARRLLPYIPDAVPGWLDACLTLYDAGGKELAFVDDYRFCPDPVLICNVPKDGEYLLELRDMLYRGRPEFVYRLKIGVLPHVTHIYPLGGQRSAAAQIELFGANLPEPTMNLAVPGDSPPVRSVELNHNTVTSNALPFAVGELPETREAEPNDTPAQANRVGVPVAIHGRIQRSGDSDYFVFKAQAGQTLVMEVYARRLDSPLDSILTLFNSKGEELAENDDNVDAIESLVTHHADSRLVYTFPAVGDYVLRIRDVQGNGGEEYAYRLVIAPPRPDFALRITPDSARIGRGDTAVIAVTSVRKDGYGGPIQLAVQNLPPGFAASDGVVPAGQDQARLTITAPRDASVPVFSPTIVGTATIGKETVVRKAEGAESVMQAFSYTHVVPAKEYLVAVLEPTPLGLSVLGPPKDGLEIRQGTEALVIVRAFRKEGLKGPVDLAADAPPPGVTFKAAAIPADKDEIAVPVAVAKEAAVGARYNLILTGTLKTGKETFTRFAPAIPIKVVSSK
jgi:hypothetical protein